MCSYCGRDIVHNMARHVSMYHSCGGSRCHGVHIRKELPRTVIDHIRMRHHVGLSVKIANLGKWLSPWTVTRVAWSAALKPNVSGIATGVVLFSDPAGTPFSWVYGEYVSYSSLRGTFKAKLSEFTNRSCVEAQSVVKRGRDSSRPAPSPLGPTHRMPDHDPPA